MRTNLVVPYSEKDLARRMGARWDPAQRVWFVQDVENIQKFMRWMPQQRKLDRLQRQLAKRKKGSPNGSVGAGE